MEEKKLTDEEIVKIFEHCANNDDCEKCKCYYAEDKITGEFCHFETMDIYIKLLAIIHRLQSESVEQKAEIERLKAEINQRREMMSRMDCNYATELQKNGEIQKQVKSLTEENKELYKENTTLIAGSILERKDIAKDTAKEILQGFDKWLKQAIGDSYDKAVRGSIHYAGKNSAFHEVKELVKKVAESKGVEVE